MVSQIQIILAVITVIVIIMLFNRGPSRASRPAGHSSFIYSPAFGTIMDVIHSSTTTTVCIFLSPFDIHRQFFPISGILESTTFDNSGKFNIASSEQKSRNNTKLIHTISSPHGYSVKVKQIAGFLVRKLCSQSTPGAFVESGDYLGRIQFGSRVDIEFPSRFTTLVKKNQKVTAYTPIAGTDELYRYSNIST